MSIDVPILVTGAAGRVGGVGSTVVEMLRQRDLPVRALVRREDERAEALCATGAEVVVTVLASPTGHIGRVYELTGPRSQSMRAVAAEYSTALGRTITYVDVPLEQWRDQELRSRNLPDHVFEHLLTMARLHAANRYDRLTHDVEAITGRPATGIREFVAHHAELFGQSSLPEKVSGAS